MQNRIKLYWHNWHNQYKSILLLFTKESIKYVRILKITHIAEFNSVHANTTRSLFKAIHEIYAKII